MLFEVQPRSPDLIITTLNTFRWSRKLSGGPKTHQIAPFISKFSGGGACPLTPLHYFESTFFIGLLRAW